jgi:hypothetical protein
MRLDQTERLHKRLVYYMMLRSGQYTLLPELLDVVGEEKMSELLKLFAGNTLQFPTLDELNRYAKEVNIYFRLQRITNEHRRANAVKELAGEYMVDESTVRRIYHKVARIVSDSLGVKEKKLS